MSGDVYKNIEHEYVTSSRAAQLSQYSQDYVGQLCRDGSIGCKRISGEWHVLLSSILAYRKRFHPEQVMMPSEDAIKPGYQELVSTGNHKDALSDDEGDIYVSSSDAAKKTGYTQDYIGQLARSGAISAKKVGRKWFVQENELLQHKKHNDDLLSAVQADSVGSQKQTGLATKTLNKSLEHESREDGIKVTEEKATHSIPIVTYKRDDGVLLPGSQFSKKETVEEYLPEVKVPTRIQKEVLCSSLEKTQTKHKNIRRKSIQSNAYKRVPQIKTNNLFLIEEGVNQKAPSVKKGSLFLRMITLSLIAFSSLLITLSFFMPSFVQTSAVSIFNIDIKNTEILENNTVIKKLFDMTEDTLKYKK